MSTIRDFLVPYSTTARSVMGHGANFHIGVSKRFVPWVEQNGWDTETIPENVDQVWVDGSVAQGRTHQASEKERVLINHFLHFVRTGEILTKGDPVYDTGSDATAEAPPEADRPQDTQVVSESLPPQTQERDPVADTMTTTQPYEPTPESPMVPVPVTKPPPKPKAPPKPQATPRDGFAGVLPAQGRIRVYRRDDLGSLAPIGEYTADDVSGEGPIGFFLKRHVEPHYGPGTYEVRRVGATGQDTLPGWKIVLLSPLIPIPGTPLAAAPPSAQPSPGSVAQLREMLELVQKLQSTNVSVPPDLMKRIEELQSVVNPARAAGNATNPNEMVDRLLQIHYTENLMEAIRSKRNQSGGDPSTVARLDLLARDLEEMKRRSFDTANAPPLPMPPPAAPIDLPGIIEKLGTMNRQGPAPDPYDGLARVMTAINQNAPQGPDPVEQLGGLVQAISPLLPKNDVVTERLAALERKLENGDGKSNLDKLSGDLRNIIELAKALGMTPQGGGAQATTGFFQLARDVIMNAPQVAEAAMKVIVASKALQQRQLAERNAEGTEERRDPAPPEAAEALRKIVGEVDPTVITEHVFTAVHAFATDPVWGAKLAPAMQRLQGGDKDAIKVFVRNLLEASGLMNLATEDLLEKVASSLAEVLPGITGTTEEDGVSGAA